MWNPSDHFQVHDSMRISIWQAFVFCRRMLVTVAKHCEWRCLSISHYAPCLIQVHLIVLHLIILDRPWVDKLIFFVSNNGYHLWICGYSSVAVTVSTKSVATHSRLFWATQQNALWQTEMRVCLTRSKTEKLSIKLTVQPTEILDVISEMSRWRVLFLVRTPVRFSFKPY